MKFSNLGLTDELTRKCELLNYTRPTPIQKEAIPIILKNSDLIACAETGTGKTAAFLLPAIEKMMAAQKPGIRVLVIAPTRELATQIEAVYLQLAPKNFSCITLIGGTNIKTQCAALRRGVSTVIATPGRLFDHIARGTINLSKVDTLVLDEADRMLDMGFLPAITKIIDRLPSKRQNLLFSATMSAPIRELARSIMNEPATVEISRLNRTAQTVEQTVYPVATASKTALLLNLLESNTYERTIIFTRTKRGAERLAHILSAREMKANRIHADRSQRERERALREFKDGRTQVLVATDIASRGIDVDAISHVINYDVPEAPQDYVHRVGRTGRAGNSGQAITLVSPIEEVAMRSIEQMTAQKVKRIVLPEFGGAETAFTLKNLSGVTNSSVRSFHSRGSKRFGR